MHQMHRTDASSRGGGRSLDSGSRHGARELDAANNGHRGGRPGGGHIAGAVDHRVVIATGRGREWDPSGGGLDPGALVNSPGVQRVVELGGHKGVNDGTAAMKIAGRQHDRGRHPATDLSGEESVPRPESVYNS